MGFVRVVRMHSLRWTVLPAARNPDIALMELKNQAVSKLWKHFIWKLSAHRVWIRVYCRFCKLVPHYGIRKRIYRSSPSPMYATHSIVHLTAFCSSLWPVFTLNSLIINDFHTAHANSHSWRGSPLLWVEVGSDLINRCMESIEMPSSLDTHDTVATLRYSALLKPECSRQTGRDSL